VSLFDHWECFLLPFGLRWSQSVSQNSGGVWRGVLQTAKPAINVTALCKKESACYLQYLDSEPLVRSWPGKISKPAFALCFVCFPQRSASQKVPHLFLAHAVAGWLLPHILAGAAFQWQNCPSSAALEKRLREQLELPLEIWACYVCNVKVNQSTNLGSLRFSCYFIRTSFIPRVWSNHHTLQWETEATINLEFDLYSWLVMQLMMINELLRAILCYWDFFPFSGPGKTL